MIDVPSIPLELQLKIYKECSQSLAEVRSDYKLQAVAEADHTSLLHLPAGVLRLVCEFAGAPAAARAARVCVLVERIFRIPEDL